MHFLFNQQIKVEQRRWKHFINKNKQMWNFDNLQFTYLDGSANYESFQSCNLQSNTRNPFQILVRFMDVCKSANSAMHQLARSVQIKNFLSSSKGIQHVFNKASVSILSRLDWLTLRCYSSHAASVKSSPACQFRIHMKNWTILKWKWRKIVLLLWKAI